MFHAVYGKLQFSGLVAGIVKDCVQSLHKDYMVTSVAATTHHIAVSC